MWLLNSRLSECSNLRATCDLVSIIIISQEFLLKLNDFIKNEKEMSFTLWYAKTSGKIWCSYRAYFVLFCKDSPDCSNPNGQTQVFQMSCLLVCVPHWLCYWFIADTIPNIMLQSEFQDRYHNVQNRKWHLVLCFIKYRSWPGSDQPRPGLRGAQQICFVFSSTFLPEDGSIILFPKRCNFINL
jgi:hypothetical protein